MSKLLSIIIPSYNMEKYLPKCLDSLIVDDAALLQLLDVIVVNDGSKDRTSEIAHEFAAKYPDVFHILDKPNGNYGSCINAAIPVAQGQFVKILDADDAYDTMAFAQYLRKLTEMSESTDMVMNDYVEVDDTGAVQRTLTYNLPIDSYFTIDTLVEKKCQMAMHAVAYRTAMVKEIGYKQIEGISYTDTEWFYLPAASAKSCCYIRSPVYRYLVGRAGQTMEWKTLVKNFWMLDKIFDHMLKQYKALKQDGRLSYLEFQLKRMFSLVTMLHCCEMPYPISMTYIKAIPSLVCEYPFLSSVLRERVIFVRSPFRFYYLDFVVKHPSLVRPILAFVRQYNRARSQI